ncbi:MAG TPA: hypothetical protein EYG74_08305 [Sulfurimonas autotrophica]|nr:hypothetical protein [Sulfurimonas autotrophica]
MNKTFPEFKLIDSVSFNNFKPFGEKMQYFSRKPITLIYGPNSVGKSSLIHLLAYHHKSLFEGDFDIGELSDFGDSISLGGFKEFVHKKNENNTIKLEYVLNFIPHHHSKSKIIMDIGIPAKEHKAKDVKIQYAFDNEVFIDINYISDGHYSATVHAKHKMIKEWTDEIFKDYENWNIEALEKALDLETPIKFPIKGRFNESFIKNAYFSDKCSKDDLHNRKVDYLFNWSPKQEELKLPISDISKAGNQFSDLDGSCMLLEDDVILSLRSILCQLALEEVFNMHQQIKSLDKVAKNYFTNFSYIGPLRFYPKRNDNIQGNLNSNTIVNQLKEKHDIINKLNDWFANDKLNLPYKIEYKHYYDRDKILDENGLVMQHMLDSPADIKELLFKDKRTNTLVHNREMGLGVTQILPILIETIGKKYSTIAVEQPELHLHPALQMEIADEFIRSYTENSNNFLIETHSEHLLLRIMKRMRYAAEDKEGRDKTLDLTPDDVCLLYVDNNGEFTYINELELAADGSLLDPWPNGFFEEGYKERFD